MKQFSKKNRLILTLLVLIIVLLATIFVVAGNSYQKNNKVIAKVNGEKIYQSELEDKLSKMFQNQANGEKIVIENFPSQVVEALAQDVYLQKELDKIAKKSKVAKDQNLQKQINDYKNSVLRQAYLNDLIAQSITDKAVKDKYSELSGELSGKKEMHLKHILVASEEAAQKIIKELKGKKAASFEQLAKKYSTDEANAAAGGDLGYVIPDNLDEDFAKALSSLAKGQVSDPIKTKFGWHIVLVKDIRDVNLPAFEEVKSNIEDQLKQETVEKLFSSITKNAKIKILVKLKPLDEAKTPEVKAPEAGDATKEAAKDEVKADAKKDETKK